VEYASDNLGLGTICPNAPLEHQNWHHISCSGSRRLLVDCSKVQQALRPKKLQYEIIDENMYEINAHMVVCKSTRISTVQ
jgi:hypothetical protein